MMSRKITIMALMGGVVLGAAATAGFNVYRQTHDSQIFQERVRCKAAADAYVKVNTDLNDNSETGRNVSLYKVDYSPARNSCIAEVETTSYFKGGHWYMKACKTCFRERPCSLWTALKAVWKSS